MFSMSKHYERYAEGLEYIKEKAFQNLKDNAEKLGANAVVGIQLDNRTRCKYIYFIDFNYRNCCKSAIS